MDLKSDRMTDRGAKIVKKWKVIKLGRERRETFLQKFIERINEKLPESIKILEEVSFEQGREDGERVSKELNLKGVDDLIETVFMLHGARVEVSERESEDETKRIILLEIDRCPMIGGITNKNSCKAYIGGLASSMGYNSEIRAKCSYESENEDRCYIIVNLIPRTAMVED
jgi:hypothetical protein